MHAQVKYFNISISYWYWVEHSVLYVRIGLDSLPNSLPEDIVLKWASLNCWLMRMRASVCVRAVMDLVTAPICLRAFCANHAGMSPCPWWDWDGIGRWKRTINWCFLEPLFRGAVTYFPIPVAVEGFDLMEYLALEITVGGISNNLDTVYSHLHLLW